MWTQIDLTPREYKDVTDLLQDTAHTNKEFNDLLTTKGNLILDRLASDEPYTPNKIALPTDLFEKMTGIIPQLASYPNKKIIIPENVNTHGWGKLYGSIESYNDMRGPEDGTLPRPVK
ncbi:hypothetical protein ACFQ21_00835 [Ohtaekwangia kribbensis]|uniref:Uncharacterized protein n=1 Tax=Ohtaekwangia kribbensis TaxID=688913 RepID=A0ABW3JVC4_9BACT